MGDATQGSKVNGQARRRPAAARTSGDGDAPVRRPKRAIVQQLPRDIPLHLVGFDAETGATLAGLFSALYGRIYCHTTLRSVEPLAAHPGIVLVLDEDDAASKAIAAIHDEAMWCPVVAVMPCNDSARAFALRSRGACGCLALDLAGDAKFWMDRFVGAVSHIIEEARWITCRLDDWWALMGLTPREVQVLAGLCAGKSSRAMSDILGISARTIEIHRANLQGKLGARASTQAVRLAIEAGFQFRQVLANRPSVRRTRGLPAVHGNGSIAQP